MDRRPGHHHLEVRIPACPPGGLTCYAEPQDQEKGWFKEVSPVALAKTNYGSLSWEACLYFIVITNHPHASVASPILNQLFDADKIKGGGEDCFGQGNHIRRSEGNVPSDKVGRMICNQKRPWSCIAGIGVWITGNRACCDVFLTFGRPPDCKTACRADSSVSERGIALKAGFY